MFDFMRNFESLGSNCELGFVLRRAGVKDATMFKWTLIEQHDHLIAALAGNLDGIYELRNLRPRSDGMVRDSKYGLCFHTSLPIQKFGSTRVFGGSAKSMAEIYERERAKFRHFASTFLKRLEVPEKIYVYRRNEELSDEAVRMLLRLLRKPGGNASLLLMRQADAQHPPGTVTVFEDGLYAGYLRHLSTSPALDDIDYDGWLETCSNAWRIHAALRGLPQEGAPAEQADEAPARLPREFDPVAYLLANPDVAEAGTEAGDHYLRHGWRERRALS